MIMKLKLVSIYLIYVLTYKFGLPTIKKLKIFFIQTNQSAEIQFVQIEILNILGFIPEDIHLGQSHIR